MATGLESLLVAWGLPLVTAGCFVEGDGVATLAGAIARRSTWSFPATVAAAALGSYLSDQFWFHIGRRFAHHAYVCRLLDRPVAARLGAGLKERPTMPILGYRFVWGLGIVAPVVFGAARISPLRFAITDLATVMLWATVMVGIGYGLGAAVERLLGRLDLGHHLTLVAILALALATALAVLRRARA